MEIYCHTPEGYEGELVRVETDLRRGIPGFDMTGLAGASVREARERVRAALRNSGWAFPLDRILVNLSPADLPKSGSGFDLALALSLLGVTGQVNLGAEPVLALGELQLDGSVRPVSGALSAAITARDRGVRHLVVSRENAAEVRLVKELNIHPLEHLSQAGEWISRSLGISMEESLPSERKADQKLAPDLAHYHGQSLVRKALEVCAAGAHNLLLLGPPGGGKTLAARCLQGILPSWKSWEAMETTRLWSLAGVDTGGGGLLSQRPFRLPHHSATLEGLVGGGNKLRPGEISLAHRGVLFLDEAPEYRPDVLQGLREPLESGSVSLVRAGRSYHYPSRFQMVMTANPCPCGQLGRLEGWCTCSPQERGAYLRRLGGALLDRIDLRLEVYPGGLAGAPQETSAQVRIRVEAARKLAEDRWGGDNAGVTLEQLTQTRSCRPDLGEKASHRYPGLSARGLVLVWKVARTLADLDGREVLEERHFDEAWELRGGTGGQFGWF